MSLNVVAIVGNLTRNPELRETASGTSVCSLRIANNDRRKVGDEWTEVPGYYDVVVFGRQAESAAQYLAKGRPVGISGRLSWREWEDKEGNKRQSVEIVANEVQFLGSRDAAPSGDDAPAEF